MRQSSIAIIGAPLDLGQGRRGVDMGPSAMRVANLNKRLASLGYEVEDLGNVPVEQQESLPEGPRHAKFLPQISAVCERLGDMVTQASMEGKAPLVIGGDHSGGRSFTHCGSVRNSPGLRLGISFAVTAKFSACPA